MVIRDLEVRVFGVGIATYPTVNEPENAGNMPPSKGDTNTSPKNSGSGFPAAKKPPRSPFCMCFRAWEHWDNSGFAGMKYILKAGIAYLQRQQPGSDAREHASVALDEK